MRINLTTDKKDKWKNFLKYTNYQGAFEKKSVI